MTQKRNIHAPLLRIAAATLVSLIIVLAFITQSGPPKDEQQIHAQTVASKKQAQAKSKLAQAVPQAAAITPTAQPAPLIKASLPKISPPLATTVKPQPVVTPSPSSNVSGLTPETTTPPASSPTSPSPNSGSTTTTSYTSTNWSGYLTTGGIYTTIQASWDATSPVGISGENSADSTWIGIGGVTSSDLIQVGTQNFVTSNGTVETTAFYEMLPNASVTITSLTVKPDDIMTASLSETSTNQWLISITDNTSNQTFSTTLDYSSANSSAEWIEEDPSYSFRHLIPFDNFQIASFYGASTTSNGSSLNISSSDALPVTMVDGSGQAESTPSSIASNGNSFTITGNT